MRTKFGLILPLAAALIFGCSSDADLFAPSEVPEVQNKFDLQTLWSAGVGSGVGQFYSELSPAFAEGTVYAASRNGDVYALAASSGDKVWHTDLSDEEENNDRRSTRLSGGVSAYAGKVAIGSENGYVYLLNAIDGSLLWKTYVAAEVVSKPAFSAGADKLFVYDSAGRLTALNLSDGKVLWVSGETATGLRLRAQGDPVAVGNEYVVIGQASGNVSVISQDNGAIVNQIVVAQSQGANALERVRDVSSTPLILGDSMYLTSYRGGYAEFSFRTQTFTTRLGYSSSQAPALDDTSIVIVEDDGRVVCINRADNSERWSVNNLLYRNLTAPVIYGNYAVTGDFEGYLYFINLATGNLDGVFELDSSGIYTAALQNDGHLYVQSRDGDLYCLHYDPANTARQKELALKQAMDYAGVGVSLARPGVGATGIYAPDSMTYEQLSARRQAVLRLAAQAEARQRAADAQRREYERRKAEYEARMKAIQEAERERLSGFGIMPGVKSEGEDDTSSAAPAQSAPQAAPEVSTPSAEEYQEKASGFGL